MALLHETPKVCSSFTGSPLHVFATVLTAARASPYPAPHLMADSLNTSLQLWRKADAEARLEERRLFYAAVDSVNGWIAPTDQEWIACGELRAVADKLFELATHPLGAQGARPLREEGINGISIVIQVRAVGLLGWTWSYVPAKGMPESHSGPLLGNEEAAFASALCGAQRTIGATRIAEPS